MKIGSHNLDDALLQALNEDLRAVREAPARRRPLPDVRVHVAALERGDLPPGLLDAPAVDREPLRHPRARAGLLDVGDAAPQAAAFVGTIWQKNLASKVVTIQEGEIGHGHGAPPVGIAQNDHIKL